MVSDEVLLALTGLATTVVTVVGAYCMAKLNRMEKTGDKTHALVNSSRGELLELQATTAEGRAAESGDPEHIEAARVARRNVNEHQKQQKIANGINGKH